MHPREDQDGAKMIGAGEQAVVSWVEDEMAPSHGQSQRQGAHLPLTQVEGLSLAPLLQN